jgi:hypothetical protein
VTIHSSAETDYLPASNLLFISVSSLPRTPGFALPHSPRFMMALSNLAGTPHVDGVRLATLQDLDRLALVEQTGDEESETQSLFHGAASLEIRIKRARDEWQGILAEYDNWIILVVENILGNVTFAKTTNKIVAREVVGLAAIVLPPGSPRCKQFTQVCLRVTISSRLQLAKN